MWIEDLRKGKFDEAYLGMGSMDEQNFRLLQEYALMDEDMIYYEFLKFVMERFDDSSDIHYLASELLSSVLNIFPNGYSLGYYHALEALKRSPDDYSLLEHLLLYYEIPDRLLSREEAVRIANKILIKYPNNLAAKQILR